MLRWLRRLLWGAMLLMAAAFLCLWVRSYRTLDLIGWTRYWVNGGQYEAGAYQIESGRGVVGLSIYRFVGLPSVPGARNGSGWGHESRSADDFVRPTGTRWRRFGFGTETGGPDPVHGVSGATVSAKMWWVPHWLPALLLLVPPAIWLIASHPLRARRRRAMGLCVQCGYDLRASPGRCPECGTTNDSLVITGTAP